VRYDVTIMGEPGEVLRAAFSDLTVRQGPGVTMLTADLDQAGLNGLLNRIADLGIELVAVRRGGGRPQVRGTGSATTDEDGGRP
jgi:hypothetical protein